MRLQQSIRLLANARTGLAWPANYFGGTPSVIPLDETRHFMTLYLPAGQTTASGPLHGLPPIPHPSSPSDHWCPLYPRLNVKITMDLNHPDIDATTAVQHSIAWRTSQGRDCGRNDAEMPFQGCRTVWGAFLVRNIHTDALPVDRRLLTRRVSKPGTFSSSAAQPETGEYCGRSKAKIEGFRRP